MGIDTDQRCMSSSFHFNRQTNKRIVSQTTEMVTGAICLRQSFPFIRLFVYPGASRRPFVDGISLKSRLPPIQLPAPVFPAAPLRAHPPGQVIFNPFHIDQPITTGCWLPVTHKIAHPLHLHNRVPLRAGLGRQLGFIQHITLTGKDLQKNDCEKDRQKQIFDFHTDGFFSFAMKWWMFSSAYLARTVPAQQNRPDKSGR